MNILPQASGTRPHLACEILPQGVVAGRSSAANAALEAVSLVTLARGVVAPGLKPGNLQDRAAVVDAIRNALEKIGERANARDGDLTLVIPDAAVRVLLLEFEALPARAAEALPLVRFRLKKLLPFDADEAMVSYQILSSSKAGVRALAVGIPRDVLGEYEAAVRAAGFEPGAVLPSTLASLAVLPDTEPALLVNANPLGVTAAIVRAGVLLLHRSVDLQEHGVPGHGVPGHAVPGNAASGALPPALNISGGQDAYGGQDSSGGQDASGGQDSSGGQDAGWAYPAWRETSGADKSPEGSPAGSRLEPVPWAGEIAQAVSVAAAYFEDTLSAPPAQVLSAGPLGAERLSGILRSSGVVEEGGWKVRELVEETALQPRAVKAVSSLGWLAGVVGALRG